MDIWSHTLPVENNEYARQLMPEYHYLYIIMHMMNHFMAAGTGIRSIMDIWVMNNHYSDKWDRALIENLLKDYGLFTFEKYALALADKWFGLDGVSYLPNDIETDVLENYESYILESGTYGSTAHSITREIDSRTDAASKIKFLLARLFLPYDAIKKIYPVLEKYPLLLPLMWVRRAFEVIFLRGKSTKTKMKAVAKADNDSTEKQNELMRSIMD